MSVEIIIKNSGYVAKIGVNEMMLEDILMWWFDMEVDSMELIRREDGRNK